MTPIGGGWDVAGGNMLTGAPPLAPLAEAFNAGAESLTSILEDQLQKLRNDLLDERVKTQRLSQELALANLRIERYERGLM